MSLNKRILIDWHVHVAACKRENVLDYRKSMHKENKAYRNVYRIY